MISTWYWNDWPHFEFPAALSARPNPAKQAGDMVKNLEIVSIQRGAWTLHPSPGIPAKSMLRRGGLDLLIAQAVSKRLRSQACPCSSEPLILGDFISFFFISLFDFIQMLFPMCGSLIFRFFVFCFFEPNGMYYRPNIPTSHFCQRLDTVNHDTNSSSDFISTRLSHDCAAS